MKFSLLIFFICFHTNINAQMGIPVLTYADPYNSELVEPELDSLHKNNGFVLIFMVKSSWTKYSDFFILTRNGAELKAYKYIIQRVQHLAPLKLSADTLTALWNAFASNDLFSLSNVNTNNNCPVDTVKKDGKVYYVDKFSISDASTYQFLMLTKDQIKKLSFYAPEFYERYCPGLVERQKVIKAASVFMLYLN